MIKLELPILPKARIVFKHKHSKQKITLCFDMITFVSTQRKTFLLMTTKQIHWSESWQTVFFRMSFSFNTPSYHLLKETRKFLFKTLSFYQLNIPHWQNKKNLLLHGKLVLFIWRLFCVFKSACETRALWFYCVS